MNNPHRYLAFDFGAESGRALLGTFDGEKIDLQEVHRFANRPVSLPIGDDQSTLHWNILQLWAEIKTGLTIAARDSVPIAGIGIDTWGVDFGLLDRNGTLIANPVHYRDARTDGMMEVVFRQVSRADVFEQTGIQFMQLNTLYQLMALVSQKSPLLDVAQTFLTIPDLFNFWLTGEKVSEFSIATTTQMYDPRQRAWATPMLQKLGIPTHILPQIIASGTRIGHLTASLAQETGIGEIPVVAPVCHDTGSAVAAVPAERENFVWLSSGTWSIMGVEVAEPVINQQALAFNLTNEGGIDGTFRLCKNVTGLWLLQECLRTWAQAGNSYTYAEAGQLAAAAQPLRSLVDPDYAEFLKPGDMPARIRAFCQRTDQPILERPDEIIRCVLESLALKYRMVLESLELTLGYSLGPIHIVGGGSQNVLLNQFTANATKRQVITGPVEATATGNILVQALGLGDLSSLAEGRELVKRSTERGIYEPSGEAAWDDAYALMRRLSNGR